MNASECSRVPQNEALCNCGCHSSKNNRLQDLLELIRSFAGGFITDPCSLNDFIDNGELTPA